MGTCSLILGPKCLLSAAPTARFQPRLEAAAELGLEGISCKPLLGKAVESIHSSRPDPMPCQTPCLATRGFKHWEVRRSRLRRQVEWELSRQRWNNVRKEFRMAALHCVQDRCWAKQGAVLQHPSSL